MVCFDRAASAPSPYSPKRFSMLDTGIKPEDTDAIQLLTDRFALRPNHVQQLLDLALGDRLLVESALVVAREMGNPPYEGAHQYIVDVLRPAAPRDKKLDRAP